ncbi:MAG: class I SAM-dependent methyltransferase [Gammaproteobacteria bacterium]|nr:class I SAM-dependent methyltransferase [Gammaproteobacteria bacterium]
MNNPMVDNDCIQATVNNRGFMFKNISDVSLAFINFAETAQYPLLDIGCAYGVTTLPVVRKERTIIACDLEQRHLDYLLDRVEEKHRQFIHCKQGSFPDDLSFQTNSLSAVHISHVLHFLSGDKIIEGLSKIKHWLVPEGKVFLNIGTPYSKFMSFEEEFDRRIKRGYQWPGEMNATDIEKYFSDDFKKSPEESKADYLHLFNKESFQTLLQKVGFTIDELYYYDPELPSDLQPILGGERAWLCAVISKKTTL